MVSVDKDVQLATLTDVSLPVAVKVSATVPSVIVAPSGIPLITSEEMDSPLPAVAASVPKAIAWLATAEVGAAAQLTVGLVSRTRSVPPLPSLPIAKLSAEFTPDPDTV